MNVLRHTEPGFSQRLRALSNASSLFDPTIEERTRAIVEAVRTRGDKALLEFTERFDGAMLTADQLAVTSAELLDASLLADESLRSAVATAAKNIEFFSLKSLRRNWTARNAQGGRVGEKFDPFGRVGIYVPGGAAPLVSTCLMTIVLARVAGCREIVVCTPCGADGRVNAGILFAARAAGATEIYRLGGAQAIAAMALGTATLRPVQKVFGPGNTYVVAAKRLLFGRVAIDLLPGPSEVLVLADDSADPRFAAADLLAQAEHGSGHERVWLVTTSAKVLGAVRRECTKQLPKLSRRVFIQRALANNGWLIQVKTLADGIDLVNRIAPEHCEIMTKQPAKVAERITTAGAIFLGPWSPTVLGDYVAGPSHTLPTGGAGASFAGLTVDQFQRRTSVVEYRRASLKKSTSTLLRFAEIEGLDAHGRSALIRLGKS
ncbi:MAG TPA: histidinol dehydrogenase [Verrucomicrobiae bacterium]|nr:histidinol dehydrogenase [Verrucomicrobiae bacterium]